MAEQLRDSAWMANTLGRLAEEVSRELDSQRQVCVVGIRTRGSYLAERLAEKLRTGDVNLEVGHVDITLYRDDIRGGGGRKPIQASDMTFDLNDSIVILVDDVLSTGRTVRAAMTEVMDFGRPACIRLLCLVDRGGRELPIQPDYVGEAINVDGDRKLLVRTTEIDGRDAVEVE